jgi:peptidoglycan-associated lipoprotein
MMNSKSFLILCLAIFLCGCETASQQESQIIGSGSASGSKQVDMSDKDFDTTSDSTISSIRSKSSSLNAREILEQKFLKIGTSVYFDFDKSTLNSEALAVLKEQAGFLKNYPSTKIILEGHCDERGTREYNLALGDRRAAAARDFLVANGIDDKRIKLISYGKEKPFVAGSNSTSWAINRRAVSVIIEK